jgi:hypothetical protein
MNYDNKAGFEMSREDAAEFLAVLCPHGYVNVCKFHNGQPLSGYRQLYYDMLEPFHCRSSPDFKVLGRVLQRLTGHPVVFGEHRHGFTVALAQPKKLDVTSIIPPRSPSWFSCLLIAIGLRKRASTLDYLEALDSWLDKKLASS